MSSDEPRIVVGRPKLWRLLKLLFPAYDPAKNLVTFGDTIYAPQGLKPHIKAHEEVHLRQHHHSKLYAVFYTLAYRISPAFRLRSELEAYRVELKAAGPTHINEIAAKLASPLYGNLLTIEEATTLLAGNPSDKSTWPTD